MRSALTASAPRPTAGPPPPPEPSPPPIPSPPPPPPSPNPPRPQPPLPSPPPPPPPQAPNSPNHPNHPNPPGIPTHPPAPHSTNPPHPPQPVRSPSPPPPPPRHPVYLYPTAHAVSVGQPYGGGAQWQGSGNLPGQNPASGAPVVTVTGAWGATVVAPPPALFVRRPSPLPPRMPAALRCCNFSLPPRLLLPYTHCISVR